MALIRSGSYDSLQGRVGILQVHARNKKVSPDLDFAKIARATAGFTGAELMNLMNQSAILAVRQASRNFLSGCQDTVKAMHEVGNNASCSTGHSLVCAL